MLIRCLLLLGALCLAHAATAEPGAPITNALSRRAVDLNGPWQTLVDPVDNGTIDYLSRPRVPGYWEDRVPRSPDDLVEYGFSPDHTLDVPGDWNTQSERLFHYEGTVWYRKSFQRPPEFERLFLHFGAVNRRATVALNGEILGTHEVGFTPFSFEITDRARAGENVVMVRVDNTRMPDDVPGLLTDWWNYGGITREVSLLATAGTFARQWEIRLADDPERIEGWVKLDGPYAANNEVRVKIAELGVDATVPTDADGLARFSVPAPTLQRWSPESPKLYDIEIFSPDDTATDRVGFRTIRAVDGDILLNGERVFLRGICMHEEAIGDRGRAWSEEDARALLTEAKRLNTNFVRLAHYPHNEHMLRVADELGLLVWAEIPVYWVIDYENPRTLDLAKTHLREMIERDRNRASVILWSVGNETGDDPERTEFRLELGRLVKRLDPSRLLSAACFMRLERDGDRLTAMLVDDPFGELADVLAVNEYVGWYHDTPESLRGLEVRPAWNKPVLISEFGAGSKRGLRGTPEQRWTEDFAARLYNETFDWIESAEAIDGVSPWILKDFRSPRRPLYGIQDWYNRKGLISETGGRKTLFDLVANRYERWGREGR